MPCRRDGLQGSLFLCAVLSVLHNQVLVRHPPRKEEDRVGEVWTWDLYLLRFFKVCLVVVNLAHSPHLLFPGQTITAGTLYLQLGKLSYLPT